MLSKESWLIIAGALLIWGVVHAFGSVEVVYSERYIANVLYQSKVVCGDAFGVLLFDDYEAVYGRATAADCRKAARTRAAEVSGQALLVLLSIVAAFKWSSPPPAPIDSELPRLRKGDGTVSGRSRSQAGDS